MVLNVKKYTLGKIELGKNEMKLMLLLSDNKYHYSLECIAFLKLWSYTAISKIVKRINQKFDRIVVITKYGKGYKTNLFIEIDY